MRIVIKLIAVALLLVGVSASAVDAGKKPAQKASEASRARGLFINKKSDAMSIRVQKRRGVPRSGRPEHRIQGRRSDQDPISKQLRRVYLCREHRSQRKEMQCCFPTRKPPTMRYTRSSAMTFRLAEMRSSLTRKKGPRCFR